MVLHMIMGLQLWPINSDCVLIFSANMNAKKPNFVVDADQRTNRIRNSLPHKIAHVHSSMEELDRCVTFSCLHSCSVEQ
jgi:hypothetical protein